VRLTVFSMQVSDLEGIFAPFDDVIVPFEQVSCRSQLRSWKLCDRTQVQPIYRKNHKAKKGENDKCDREDGAAPAESKCVKHRDFLLHDRW